ncbi:methyl-accepting chemotaxis protein [Marinomonas sp. C1424]|uniref:Methyl-accepting chemotaxis protein n=2 Tax=Marinomonas transparens TaxID=2795388 RepID=A0A934N7Q6_9GAMM|nr:methyl-accepting chemotaxis protein [Marinomonas transparens]
MKMKLSVKKKLYVIFGSVLCITLILGFYPIRSQSDQSEILLSVIFADEALYKARLAEANYIILENPKTIGQVSDNIQLVFQYLDEAKASMSLPSSLKYIDVIKDNVGIFLDYFKKYVSINEDISEEIKSFVRVSDDIRNSIRDEKKDLFKGGAYSNNDYQLLLNLDDLNNAFNSVDVYFWQYNKDKTVELRELIVDSISEVYKEKEKLEALYKTRDSTLFNKMDSEILIYHDLFEHVVEKNALLETTKLEMIKAAHRASDDTSALVDAEVLVAKQHTEFVNKVTMGLIFTAFVICLLLGRWLTKSIMRSLNTSIDFAEGIAKGDLATRLESLGHDEFSQLNKALSEIVVSLRNVINQVIMTTRELEQSSSQISLSVDKTSDSVQQQQSETEMVATAVNELAAAALQITQSAQGASATSHDAETGVSVSQKVVSQTEKAMSELSDTLRHATSVVDDLSANSANIEGILVVIRGIADQTNLLALNAAIEAARAGEQGRGFAVVADEVRTLAQKTQDSITEINSIIESIQQGAKSVVHEMMSSNEKGELVVSLTAESSDSLNQIVNSIKVIVDTNNQVAVGAEEQSLVAEEVDRNIIKIKGLSDGNSENLGAIKSQIDTLSIQTQSMGQLVSFFKV